MNARFLKASKMRELASKIQENIELYRNGSFDFIGNDPEYYFEPPRILRRLLFPREWSHDEQTQDEQIFP